VTGRWSTGLFLGLVAGGLAIVHPFAALLVVPVLAIAFALVRSSFACLLAFIAVLFTRPTDMLPALAALQPAKVLALGSLGIWVFWKVLRRDRELVRAPTHLWMGLLTLAVYASSIVGTNRAESLRLANDSFVKIVILYILIIHLIDTELRAKIFQSFLALVVAGLGAYAFYSKLSGTAQVEGSRAALVGLLGDPNDLALILLMTTPFSIIAAIEAYGVKRLGFIVVSFLSVAGVVSTLSRGGLLGLFAAVFLTMRLYGVSTMKIGTVLGVAAVGVVASSGIQDRQSGAVGGEEIDESAQGRLDAWKAALRMVRTYPALGVGFGMFADNFERFSINPVFWGRHETHNSYLKAISEVGVLGFIPFIALIVIALRSALRMRAAGLREERGGRRALLLSTLPNLVAFLVPAFFLSQCWTWFIYILITQIVANERVLLEGSS
jgi:O-antigen ligase